VDHRRDRVHPGIDLAIGGLNPGDKPLVVFGGVTHGGAEFVLFVGDGGDRLHNDRLGGRDLSQIAVDVDVGGEVSVAYTVLQHLMHRGRAVVAHAHVQELVGGVPAIQSGLVVGVIGVFSTRMHVGRLAL